MKNAILAVALVGLAFGCKTDKQAAVSDASATPTPECAASCSDAEKAACATKCSSEAKAECSTTKTCPATGKTIE
jgi:hypothetical protein